jgi:uncharacterized protein (DUF1778 family)
MVNPVKSNTKDQRSARFGFRATLQQEAIIRRAAEMTGNNVTQFVLNSACEAARTVLTDQKLFFAGDEAYEAFANALERPAQTRPGLEKLAANRAPWDK